MAMVDVDNNSRHADLLTSTSVY